MASSLGDLFHHGVRLLLALGRSCRRAGVYPPAIPTPAKASQQEAVKSSQVLRLTLQDALALARKK